MNNVLKMLAKKARDRLKTAGELGTTKQNSTAYLSATNSYSVVANIRNIEDDPLFFKIKKLLEKCENEIIVNPIYHIIDKNFYNSLDSVEKERYMLKITKRYNLIKDYILKEKENQIFE